MTRILQKNFFYIFCVIVLFIFSAIRSHPFFGKLDFYVVDGRPWWPRWSTLIQKTRENGNFPVYTDYVTGYILAAFGEDTVLNVGVHKIPKLFIEDMEKNILPKREYLSSSFVRSKKKGPYKCIINLIGYDSSWVPTETGHWNSRIADTSKFYKFKDPNEKFSFQSGTTTFPLKNCTVYFPDKNEK